MLLAMKNFLLLICYLLIAVIVLPTFLFLALHILFFDNPIAIKKILIETNTYHKITSISPNDLETLIAESARDSQSQIQAEQLQQIISLTKPQTLQVTLEKALDSLYGSLKNNEINMEFDLIPIKQDLLAGQPESAVEAFNQMVPNTYILNISQIKNNPFLLKCAIYSKYLGILILLLLTIIVFLLSKGWRQKFLSLSITSFIIGLCLILGYFILLYLSSKNLYMIDNQSVSSGFYEIFSELAEKTIQYIALKIRIWGIISLFLGIIFIVFSRFFPSFSSPNPAVLNNR